MRFAMNSITEAINLIPLLELGCRHYGRYVDDFYVISADKEFLFGVTEQVKEMLRQYASRQMVQRMLGKISGLKFVDSAKRHNSLQSYHGLLSHGNNYHLWEAVQKDLLMYS